MHELAIALDIAELAVARSGGAQVRRVVVEVGQLTAVLGDALAFAWEAATDDTPLAGCTLDIVAVPGRGRCRACGDEQPLAVPFGRCRCGETDLELVAGEELRIRQLEVTTADGDGVRA